MSQLASRVTLLIPFLGVISFFLLASPGAPALAGAALEPTRFDDPAPDGCQPADCSLREAVIAANNSPGSDTITLAAGTYSLTIPGAEESAGATGDLNVHSALVIAGQGTDATVIDGGGNDRVMLVGVVGNLNLLGVTVRGGNTAYNGGGILNIGTLAVRDSVFQSNTADLGGAISSGSDSGRLVVDRTTIRDNSAGRVGGGVFLETPGSEATITNSTISGNTGTDGTGGVHIQSGTDVTLKNVTISGNSSPTPSAMAVTSDAVVTLTNVTIADNVSTSQFKVAIANYADIIIRNTIIQDAELGCAGDGTFQSLGHNIDDDGSCLVSSGPGDMPSTDAMLGPLADNGGPTQNHALLDGSPAINAGDDDACPFTDQRGYGRVGVCDIGAYEFGGAPVVIKQGNVNCDDEVTAVDALFILRAVAQIPPPAECLDLAGDVNCDGAKTAVDALGVLRFVAGLPVNQNEPCANVGTPV